MSPGDGDESSRDREPAPAADPAPAGDPAPAAEPAPAGAGLCATCRHRRTVTSGRGSRFVLCERSRTDPRFPRYPPLPVLACAGYDRTG